MLHCCLAQPVHRRSCRRRHLPTMCVCEAFRPSTTTSASVRVGVSQTWRSRSLTRYRYRYLSGDFPHLLVALVNQSACWQPNSGHHHYYWTHHERSRSRSRPPGPHHLDQAMQGQSPASTTQWHAHAGKDEGRSEVDLLAYPIRATTWRPCLPAGNMPSCITKAL